METRPGSEDEDNAGELDDLDSFYAPSVDPGGGPPDEEFQDDQDILDEEGDVILEGPRGEGEGRDEGEDTKRGWPASRMKRKTPPGDVEWREHDVDLTYRGGILLDVDSRKGRKRSCGGMRSRPSTSRSSEKRKASNGANICTSTPSSPSTTPTPSL